MRERTYTAEQQKAIDARKASRDASRKAAMADMWASNTEAPAVEVERSPEEIEARRIAHRAAINAANEAYAIANAPAIAEVARMVAMIDPNQTYRINVSGWGTDGFVQITSDDNKVCIQIPHGSTHTNHTGYKMSAEKAIEVIEMNIGEKFQVMK